MQLAICACTHAHNVTAPLRSIMVSNSGDTRDHRPSIRSRYRLIQPATEPGTTVARLNQHLTHQWTQAPRAARSTRRNSLHFTRSCMRRGEFAWPAILTKRISRFRLQLDMVRRLLQRGMTSRRLLAAGRRRYLPTRQLFRCWTHSRAACTDDLSFGTASTKRRAQ